MPRAGTMPHKVGADQPPADVHLTVGYWSTLASTLLGVVYALVAGTLGVMGKMTRRPRGAGSSPCLG